MATLKERIEKINKNSYLVFFLMINKIWDFGKSIFNYQDMDVFSAYWRHYDWISAIFQLTAVLVAFFILRNVGRGYKKLMTDTVSDLRNEHNERLTQIEEYLRIKDEREIEDEMLGAVAFWINAVNNSLEERDAYVKREFPRNEKKIQVFFKTYYQGMGVGIREYYKSINSQIRSAKLIM